MVSRSAISHMSQDSEYFVHSYIAPFRTEEIPNVVKEFGTISHVATFDKNNSMFKEWREDTQDKLE